MREYDLLRGSDKLRDKMLLGAYDSAENAVDGVVKLLDYVEILEWAIKKLTERVEALESKAKESEVTEEDIAWAESVLEKKGIE